MSGAVPSGEPPACVGCGDGMNTARASLIPFVRRLAERHACNWLIFWTGYLAGCFLTWWWLRG